MARALTLADAGLRERGRSILSDLLAEAITDLDGPDAGRLIARAQATADQSMAEAREVFAGLTEEQATLVAHALACHSLLGVIGEDVGARRLAAEGESETEHERPDTLPGAIASLKALPPERLKAALERLTVEPVLTAHPTEVRRRSVVDREVEISRLMAVRRHHLSPPVNRRVMQDLYREVALLWRMRLQRPQRIAVSDEIRNAVSTVRRAVLPALVDLYDNWSELLAGDPRATPLRLGSWLGGDRDGHPGVNRETLRTALRSQARVILDHYAGEVRSLWSDFAISLDYIRVTPELQALADAFPEPSVHRKDEPYRLAFEQIFDRLSATAQALTGSPVAFAVARSRAQPYARVDEFIADLVVIRDSLLAYGGERLVGRRMTTLIKVARACGFHLMSLDLRQNADVHERTLSELFARAGLMSDYAALDEATKVQVLLDELSHGRLLRSQFIAYGEETQKELEAFDGAAEAIAGFGETAIGAYVVSKTATLSDILEPLVLLKQSGVVTGGPQPTTRVRVTPLLETIGDLERGPDLLRQWLSLPITPSLIGPGRVQEVMVGYSDSNKDGGYITSRWAVARGGVELAKVCAEFGLGLQIFHGRGGSIGRGGGPAAQAVFAQPSAVVQGRLRMTEQGEMIARHYGDQPTARRTLDGLAAAVLLASEQPRPEAHVEEDPRTARLAEAAFSAYRQLVYETEGFTDFFWAATPIAEIAGLNIGSRPASRTASRRIEDLRAIPWVFSWSQARFMLPGWYGFAAGVQASGMSADQVRDLAREHGFFAVALSNMELALAQSDMQIAREYAALAGDDLAGRFYERIRAEHEAACALALAARGGEALLDDRPDLQATVRQAAAFVAPLNHLQLELLRRRRAGDDAPALRLAIQQSVTGIAAGLRNTG